MSSISANYSIQSFNPNLGDVQETDNTNKTGTENKTLTVTLNVASPTGEGGPISITLSYPLIGVEDVPLNELLQQLEKLNFKTFEGLTLTQVVQSLDSVVSKLAEGILTGGKEYFEANKKEIAKLFGDIATAAENAATALFDLINNSAYPAYADFLKEMLAMAQDLREAASESRMAALKGEYENILAQAATMKNAAQERYDKGMADINAKAVEAGFQLAGALLSIGFTGFAAGKFGLGNLQSFSGVSSGISQGMGALGSLASIGYQLQSIEHEKKAALLDAAVKEMEATQKLQQEAQTIASELSDIAKQLRDMVLKLYQDFLSSQSQIIQHANI